MPNLIRRDGNISRVLGSYFAPGAAYTVTVYRAGAEVSAVSDALVATVYPGHDFQVGDKCCLFLEGEEVPGTLRRIEDKSDESLTFDANLSLVVGDILVNLGADSGGSSVNFDGSPVPIFDNMAGGGGAIPGSTMTTTSRGDYGYYYSGVVWELVYYGMTMKGLNRVVHPEPDNAIFAHLFATSGAGTETDPWVTENSNPVQAALDAIEDTGGLIRAIGGFYDLGDADAGIEIPITLDSADKRSFSIVGDGEATVFNYRGTGTAIRYWQEYTSSGPGNSVQSNQNVLQDFQVRQTANPRVGTGIWINYGQRWRITNVGIGTPRWNRSSGDEGFDYGIQLNERSDGFHTIDDYMTISGCRFSGNTHAIRGSELSNNLRIRDCYFEANTNISAYQDGVEIANANGFGISDNAFNFFSATDSFAIKLSTDISGVKISGNYMYGNANGVFLNADGDQDGIGIISNRISLQGVAGGIGVRAGIATAYDEDGHKIRGLVVQANTFDLIQTDDIGVWCRADVANCILLGNRYVVSSGTRTLFDPGAAVMVIESVEGTASAPQIQINHYGAFLGGILLNNSSPDAGVSPRLTFKAGADGLRGGLQAGPNGQLQFTDSAGVVVFTIAQDGVITPTSFLHRTITTGIVAGTTQTLAGATQLTTEVNVVATVGTTNDGVKLPAAVLGRSCVVINNAATNTVKVWPPDTSSNIGGGTAGAGVTQASGVNARYIAISSLSWEAV